MAQNFNKNITVRLPSEKHSELREYAQKEGMNVSFMVRHLIIRFLDDRRSALELDGQRLPNLTGQGLNPL